MRLDDGFESEKLSLDITPLIDIIFLLVMFFAVSTSFISGDDLEKLKSDVLSFSTSSEQLEQQLDESSAAASIIELNLENEKKLSSDLQSQLEAGKAALAQTQLSNDELASQLQDIKSDTERREQKQALLESLLAEKQGIASELEDAQGKLQTEKAQLATQLAMLRGLLDDKEKQSAAEIALQAEQKSSLEEQLATSLQAVKKLNQSLAAQQLELDQAQQTGEESKAQEVLLQKLLAEKAAELNGLIVRLESADTAREAAEKQLAESAASEKASREQLLAEAQRAQTQVLALQAELEKFRDIADLDSEQIKRTLAAQQQLRDGMSSYLDNDSLGITRDQQKLTLQLSDKLLFASGSAKIKSEGLGVLGEIGQILKERIGDLDVQIGGHTDNVPVGGATGPLADNWGLSAARAVNVVRFFETELGLQPDQMAAVGYGEYRPISENDTSAGRSRNRRIEIVLIPR